MQWAGIIMGGEHKASFVTYCEGFLYVGTTHLGIALNWAIKNIAFNDRQRHSQVLGNE